MESLKKYPHYKPSNTPWIGDVPEHWEVKKLKWVALVQPSNVDKKSLEGEESVLLCNYMDVYKNEFVSRKINFMEATATRAEIEKFKIQRGDVLATKDSETPDDIANPALVVDDFENVICAYHLTQIRPYRNELLGEYLFRLFQEYRFKGQFEVGANGVTRFGLSISTFADAYIPLPPLPEQTRIARYLDAKTTQIDHLIAAKQRLLALLREERSAVINRAVTRGLDPAAKMKPSGVPWLGEVPEGWETSKIGYIVKVVRGASPRPAGDPQFFNGDHTAWITVAEVTKDSNKYLTDVSEYLTAAGKGQSRYIEEGTLVLSNSGATLGVPKILKIGGCINDGSIAFLSLGKGVSIDFLYYFFVSMTDVYREQMKGSGQPNLNTDIVKSTTLCLPELPEQLRIVKKLEDYLTKIENTAQKITAEIALLQEYRVALISAAVTGRIRISD